jgi:4-hydroxybenzoate polyprenyltransferase
MSAATGRIGSWTTFARERFNLVPLLVVGTAQAASAQYVVGPTLDAAGLVVAVLALTALLVVMRLMDELKDVEKDRVAHPGRPLPRGLVTPSEARVVLRASVATLFVIAAALAMRDPLVGGLFGLCVAYSLLMYREFFAPEALQARPLAYAITHQIILVPMYTFATAAAAPDAALSPPVLWFALTGLGASFTLEVCRKLDPDAHPILGTYLTMLGRGPTTVAVFAAAALTAFAAFQIGVHPVVWPAAALLVASLAVVALKPERFALAAGTSALLVVTQVLAPTLMHWTGIGR